MSGAVHFEVIPYADWNLPPWLNETRVEEEMHKMEGIPRAGSISCGFCPSLPRVGAVLMTHPFFIYLGITICADLTLGSDLPSSQSHVYLPVLTSLSSSTIVIQCCKATDILGVSSAFYLINCLTLLSYPRSGPMYTSIVTSTLTRLPSCARMTKCSVRLFRAFV